MREDKPNGGTFRISVQKQLFVFHNQIVGVNIICCGFFTANLAINHLALFINRKIACMSGFGRDRSQIAKIFSLSNTYLQIFYNVAILFFKHLCKDTITRFSVCIILFVMSNFINKKQRKDFDSLVIQLSFSLNVRENRFSNLNTAQLLLTNSTDHITSINFDTIQKLYRIITTINRLYYKVIMIFFHAVRLIIEVKSNSYCLSNFPNSRSTFIVKLNGCSRISFR